MDVARLAELDSELGAEEARVGERTVQFLSQANAFARLEAELAKQREQLPQLSTTAELAPLWQDWRAAQRALQDASAHQATRQQESERLQWQIGEVDKLAPGADEWDELNAEHQRLSHAQSLMDAARGALERIAEAEINAESLTDEALSALQDVLGYDAGLQDTVNALLGAQAQLQDAAHSLGAYLHAADLDPDRLRQLDDRLSAWVTLARRYRRFVDMFGPLNDGPSTIRSGETAFILRTLLLHEYRKIHLRDPLLPATLLPQNWAGTDAHDTCRRLYAKVFPASERYLSATVQTISGSLPSPSQEIFHRFGGLPGT